MPTITKIGENLDLTIRQGTTFTLPMRLTDPNDAPINITGYLFRGQVRKTPSAAEVIASFSSTIIDAMDGWARLTLTDEVTAAIPAGDTLASPTSLYVYDIEYELPNGSVEPLVYGQLKVFREVTR